MRFDESISIAAPPSAVFAMLADIQETAAGPGSPVAAMDKIPAGPTTVGTRWREVVRLGLGGQMTMWSEATAVEPDRLLALRFRGGSMHGEITYTIAPENGGAILRHQEWMHAVGWLRPFDRLLGRMLAPRVHRRLAAIRDQLETGAHAPTAQ
ncbi:MAG: SRPBCC family protein [Acidimicrobiia bacterium]|nr:SRPBCC family protein [Acidimicrobiia bacterium]MDH5292205.1 SRPBCC family protein [Acidimicrobiia bacterium]